MIHRTEPGSLAVLTGLQARIWIHYIHTCYFDVHRGNRTNFRIWKARPDGSRWAVKVPLYSVKFLDWNFGSSEEQRATYWIFFQCTAARALVERFDIEPFSDFSAKWANFIGLVLFCIDAKFCKWIFVGKLLTRSTRYTCFRTAQTSILHQNFVIFK